MSGLLFIDNNNACRSQIAEAFARRKAPAGIEVVSAGITKALMDPLAIQVMQEIGINIATQQAKSLNEIKDHAFDVAIAFCDCSFDNCPVLPGNPSLINWYLVKETDQKESLPALRKLRDKIKKEVDNFLITDILRHLSPQKAILN